MYVLQYREPGSDEWRSLWADIHSKTLEKARAFLDTKRRRAQVPQGSVFRLIGPKGYSYYFINKPNTAVLSSPGHKKGNGALPL